MINLYETKNSLSSISEYLNECLCQLLQLIDYDVIRLIRFNDEKNCAICKRSFFVDENGDIEPKQKRICFFKNQENSILNLMLNKNQIVFFSNDSEENQYAPFEEKAIHEIYFPIFLDDTENKCIIGCIYLGNYDRKCKANINDILNGEIYNTIKKVENLTQTIYLRSYIKHLIFSGVNTLSQVIEERAPLRVEHPYRVAHWAKAISEKLGMDKERVEKIYIAGIGHDLGKLYIDRDILNKKGQLTDEEYEEVKQHTLYGFNIIRDAFAFDYNFREIPIFIKYHHERYDGKGYPEGLKGEKIPIESRILAVANSVDIMLSFRQYKKPNNLDYIIKDLIENSGKRFDPDIAKVMIDILLKTKEDNNIGLEAFVNWGTISINTSDKTYNIEGNLGQFNEGYIFTTDKFNFSKDVDFSKVENINLYLNSRNNILQYDVKLNQYNKNRLYISELIKKPLTEAFSILWNIQGLINIDKSKKNISIYKIGGSSLCFYTVEDGLDDLLKDKIINIEVFFSDNKSIMVTGKIVKNFRVGNQYHYYLTYVSTNDNVKDKIFGEIFKKQIEMKRLIRESLRIQ